MLWRLEMMGWVMEVLRGWKEGGPLVRWVIWGTSTLPPLWPFVLKRSTTSEFGPNSIGRRALSPLRPGIQCSHFAFPQFVDQCYLMICPTSFLDGIILKERHSCSPLRWKELFPAAQPTRDQSAFFATPTLSLSNFLFPLLPFPPFPMKDRFCGRADVAELMEDICSPNEFIQR